MAPELKNNLQKDNKFQLVDILRGITVCLGLVKKTPLKIAFLNILLSAKAKDPYPKKLDCCGTFFKRRFFNLASVV